MTARIAPVIGVLAFAGILTGIAMKQWAKAHPVIPPVIPEYPEYPDLPAPEEPYCEPIVIPTANNILSSSNHEILDSYYYQISWLFTSNQIDFDHYMRLYNAYVERFYQLQEVS